VLERVVVEQSPLLERKLVEVQVDVGGDVFAALPAAVLNILLSNLVGNAFAHTREGRIVIDMEDRTLRVSNPGGDVQERDFAPFAKGGDSTGFGLGLAIVRRLCERHGIALRIDAVSDQTIARLSLPAA
jgi:signal transduction histidine kinase